MLFLPVFATVLFLFGFSTNVPGVVDGHVIANRHEPLSTDATIGSNTIIKRLLNVIPRVSPGIISSGQRQNGRNRGHRDGEPPDLDTDLEIIDSTDGPDGTTDDFDQDTPDVPDPQNPCKDKKTKKERCQCRNRYGIIDADHKC